MIDFDAYDRDDFLREPPERIVKCLGCGHGHYEGDRCDTCDEPDEFPGQVAVA